MCSICVFYLIIKALFIPATERIISRGNCKLKKYISALNYDGEGKFRNSYFKFKTT